MLCGIGSRMIAATSWSDERALDRVGVVERADDRRVEHLGQDPLRERVLRAHPLRQRDHVHRDRVVPAVVAALELDDVAPAGRGARERGARGTSPRSRSPSAAPARATARRRRSSRRARPRSGVTPTPISPTSRGCGDRGVDVGVVVAEQRRAEGGVVVGVGAAVGVREGRAARRRDHELLEPGHAALAAVHAAGDDGARRAPRARRRRLVGDSCSSWPPLGALSRTSSSRSTPRPGRGRDGDAAVGLDRQALLRQRSC